MREEGGEEEGEEDDGEDDGEYESRQKGQAAKEAFLFLGFSF